MKGSILRRIEIVEKVANVSRIDEADKLIVVTYNDGDEAEFERLVQERMVELRQKYGPNTSEDDFLIVGIRKFYREEKKENRS